MSKDKFPVTPAIRVLRAEKANFTPYLYDYEEKGGTAVSARELDVSEHSVVKTLIMEDDGGNALIVLMHGDLQVSTRELARFLGVKSVAPCTPDKANRLTGYLVGGTSPFGVRRPMPVYMEETILGLPEIYINGGKRGFLVGISPQDVERILSATRVRVGIKQ
ncbi:MAG: aminoacyl-tRNA deacylase [Geobacteraceae bacterium]|nr:aminoacyl-tRNA deacylase [Geobacteraceae bacterium]